MRFPSRSTLLRLFKPVAAGLALAYAATGLLDGPAPVSFQPEDPYVAEQTVIVEPEAELVMERNVMKLGSLLSVKADEPVGASRLHKGDNLGLFYDNRDGSSATGVATQQNE